MEQKRFCMSDYIMRIVQSKVRKDTILKILLLSFPLMHNWASALLFDMTQLKPVALLIYCPIQIS